ncbi:MAG: Lrp/AsnC family transcriptional regulator [Actinomycetaceae bacterium]|nr:Lrp/AsnC family transcriptional regulator [Actinomycetaceae bacterium]
MLDTISKQIITMLQEDGRCSYTAISKRVGLSEPAVRQRVTKLQKEGAIQIVAVTDPSTMGYSSQAMLGLKVHGPIEELATRLAQLDEVIYVVFTSGSFDLLVEVVCKDDTELIHFVDQNIRCDDAVGAVQTMRYLGIHRQDYNWGFIE